MPAFKEIGKKFRKTIDLGGDKFPVRGLNGDELVELITEFPAFERLIHEGWAAVSREMLEQSPGGIAKFVALGLSNGKAPSAEDVAEVRSWPFGAQLELLAPIAELSLPKAIVRPFVELFRDDGAGVEPGKAPDTQ